MTGRGISLQAFKKKENDESDVKSTASTSASTTQSNFFVNASGKGRGFALPSIVQPTPAAKTVVLKTDENVLPKTAVSVDENVSLTASKVAPTLSIGKGRGIAVGRGLFSVNRPSAVLSIIAGSDPKKTSTDADTNAQPAATSSGIIAGRGTSGTGRGASSGGEKLSTSLEGSGAIKKDSANKTANTDTSVETAEPVPVVKRGTKGREFAAMSNSIQLHCDPNSGFFEYEVRFSPVVDNMQFRFKYLMQHREFIGNTKTFDGVILYLPRRLPETITNLISKNIVDESNINVEIIYKRQKRLGECMQLYNVLFEKVFKILDYLRVGRKNFDPTAPQLVPQHKLELWPGYVKSVEELEAGLMLTLDVSHRVLATRTVLELMSDAYRVNKNTFKEEVHKALIGKIVLTRYNNKCYHVDDVVFDKSPKDTFPHGDGEISYIDYYKKQYNIDIRDLKQPMLISRKEVRISGEREKREYVFLLVPELCFLTGLSEKERSNYTAMKDLAAHTKLSPLQRVGAFKKFVENVNNNAQAKEVLSQWGLSLDPEPMKITARLLDEERIIFGRSKELGVGPQADFSRHATSNEVLDPINLQKWLLVYVKTNQSEADAFESTLLKVSAPTGIRVVPSRRVMIENDRTETFISSIRKELTDPNIQIVVIIFPSMRDDRYAAVKRVLCSEIPIPSQVINSKTLKNETKNRSIVQKIILQMNCKMGGTLWGIKIPLQKTMIVGIDTHHEAGNKGLTVGGFVASLNPEFTRWYSKPCIQEKREELVNGLTGSMEAALTAFKKFNSYLPERIILYRDGVGDGQLSFVQSYEVAQFKEAFERFEPGFKPKLTFVVVQKRVNTKIFKIINEKPGNLVLGNPSPGTIVDYQITHKYMYDFYLIPQYVREGTTTPSHYIVLEDENEFSPDILQRLTYKLCFLYYNWPGAVRVPAPCQYAHKLADLVGVSIKRQVAEKLANNLYFL